MAEKDDDIVVIEEKDPQIASSGEIDSSQEEEDDKKAVKQLTKKPRRGTDGNTRRGNDAQKRMNELWMAAKEKEEEANQERAKNSEYEKITASALEENINTKRELLTERLIRAQEGGDTKKSAEITAELSRIEAQSAQIERYKIENQVKSAPRQELPQQRQQQQQPSSPDDIYDNMSPSGKKWLDDNGDWYDVNSENHDPEKVGDVTYYAQTLEAEYRNSGRGAEIGTRAYFRKIDDYIKQNWSDDVDDEVQEKTHEPKKSYAAPVGNRSAASPSTSGRKEYKISQQEKEFALALNTKDPKTGRPLADDAKIKRFISLREGTPASGPISMSTIKGA